MSQDKETKVGQPAAPAVPAAPATISASAEDKLSRLLELLLSREQTNLEKEFAEKQRRLKIAEQNEKSEQLNLVNLLKFQAKCKHLKGASKTRARLRSDTKIDYNVMMHTFIDGAAVIKCLSCAARWKQGDTAEFLLRNGKKQPNVTKCGWSDGGPTGQGAIGMVQQSTNSVSSSEIPQALFTQLTTKVEDLVIPADFEF